MNVLKNMEVIFLVSTALILATNIATAAQPAPAATRAYVTSTSIDGVRMPVVHVVGKRAAAAVKA